LEEAAAGRVASGRKQRLKISWYWRAIEKVSLQDLYPQAGEETGLRLRTVGYRLNEIGIEKLSLQVLYPPAGFTPIRISFPPFETGVT